MSKVFEGFIDEQVNVYIKKYLSRYLCGYRKEYSRQTAMLFMIENLSSLVTKEVVQLQFLWTFRRLLTQSITKF